MLVLVVISKQNLSNSISKLLPIPFNPLANRVHYVNAISRRKCLTISDTRKRKVAYPPGEGANPSLVPSVEQFVILTDKRVGILGAFC